MSTFHGSLRSTLAGMLVSMLAIIAPQAFGQEIWVESDIIELPAPEPPDMMVVDPLYDDPALRTGPQAENDSLNLGGRLNLLTQAEQAPFRLFANYAPRQSVRDSNETLSANSVGGQFGAPLRIYTDGIWLATASFKTTELSTTAVLPVSGTPIPERLWDIRTGMFFTRKLRNGWTVGGLFNFGSASDEPYNSVDELTFTSIGFVNIPAQNRDTWDFSFFYSPTSQLAFPIPGLAYHWRPNDQFEAQIGLPASVVYTPNDSFVFRARYTPLTDVLVEMRQAIDRDWGFFARYQITNENYFLAGRSDRDLLFTQFEQQVAAGINFNFENGFSFELSAGYLFDRRFFLDTDFDLNSRDLIKVESGAIFTAQLVWNL